MGYDRQSPTSQTGSQNEMAYRTAPAWATNGSYLVYRRLRQDMPAFQRFIKHGVKQLRNQGVTVDPERFGAMCVGRWKSGVPISRAPLADDPAMAADENVNATQSFFFDSDTQPIRFTYGPAWKPRERKGVDRGLLFLCYQRSIAEQFEFVWRVWSNKAGTPRAGAGIDPIIGQNGDHPPKERAVHFAIDDATKATVTIPERFITSTGGAYLFVPSIDAMTNTLAR